MAPPPVSSDRDLRLDLFRGIALWLIFLDHIPSNVVNWITIRNYGFSDAAEIFVFISGYTAAFVYSRSLHQNGPIVSGARILKRAWQVYVAHIFLFVIFMAQVAFVSAQFQNPLFTEEMGAFDFIQQPGMAVIQALLLKFKPVYLDILPMYVVLLVALAPALWLFDRRPHLALALSVVLYLVATRLDWNLPSYPSGGWFFNPLAWQLLFMIGVWCALGDGSRTRWLLRSNLVLGLAVGYLIVAFAITLTWHVPAFGRFMPRVVADLIYPIDKTNLGPLRLLHFLSVALITVRLIPRDWRVLTSPWLRPAILCGQHSLEIFCLGVFLSFTGHFIMVEVSNRFWVQVAISVTGVVIMVGLAALLRWYRMIDGRRPGPRPPSPGLAGGEA